MVHFDKSVCPLFITVVMTNEQLWLLLSLKLSGEAGQEELAALDKLLAENPQLDFQVSLFTQMWQKQRREPADVSESFNRHLQRLSSETEPTPAGSLIPGSEVILAEKPGTSVRSFYIKLTAAAAVVIGAFYLYKFISPANIKQNGNHAAHNTVITKKGSKSNIQLPDGTTVWLNADTKIKYDEKFLDDFREVELEGEAFFDVVTDPERPFIIHTKAIDIKVLGTAFNVRAYASEKNTETSLIRGQVEVTLNNNPEKKIILKPNEKLRVHNEGHDLLHTGKKAASKNDVSIAVSKVHFEKKDSAALETLWMKNKLVFDEESLQEVMQKIERWYDVKIVFEGDENMRNMEYSAIFENETLTQVLDALKYTGNFEYSISKNQVYIR